jgi:hypothetical protein
MRIEKHGDQVGVDVHFDPCECELFIRLAADLEKLHHGSDELSLRVEMAQSYFSLSAELGKKIRALAPRE